MALRGWFDAARDPAKKWPEPLKGRSVERATPVAHLSRSRTSRRLAVQKVMSATGVARSHEAARDIDARYALPAHRGRYRQRSVVRLPGDLSAARRHRSLRRGGGASRQAARHGGTCGQCPEARGGRRRRYLDELWLSCAIPEGAGGRVARAGRDPGTQPDPPRQKEAKRAL